MLINIFYIYVRVCAYYKIYTVLYYFIFAEFKHLLNISFSFKLFLAFSKMEASVMTFSGLLILKSRESKFHSRNSTLQCVCSEFPNPFTNLFTVASVLIEVSSIVYS